MVSHSCGMSLYVQPMVMAGLKRRWVTVSQAYFDLLLKRLSPPHSGITASNSTPSYHTLPGALPPKPIGALRRTKAV